MKKISSCRFVRTFRQSIYAEIHSLVFKPAKISQEDFNFTSCWIKLNQIVFTNFLFIWNQTNGILFDLKSSRKLLCAIYLCHMFFYKTKANKIISIYFIFCCSVILKLRINQYFVFFIVITVVVDNKIKMARPPEQILKENLGG